MAVKKINRENLPDVFEQAIKDKTIAYEKARNEILEKMDMIEYGSHNEYDSGLTDIEDRNELNFLRSQLNQLEKDYQAQIEGLKTR